MKAKLLATVILLVSFFAAPANAALPREQFLVADASPVVDRGAAGALTFTATRSVTSVVKQISIAVPPGVTIVAVGPGRTGMMPQCRIRERLPANSVTCVASLSGDAYFTFLPAHSISLSIRVDADAALGMQTGLTELEQRYDGIHRSFFGVTVTPTVIFNNEASRPKRQIIEPLLAATAFSIISTALMAWHVNKIGLSSAPSAVQLPSSQRPVYVRGTPGSEGSRYSAVGQVSPYIVNRRPDGNLSLSNGGCSGVIVPSAGKNLLMTAAHCLVNVDPTTKKASWWPLLSFCANLSADQPPGKFDQNNPLSCPPKAVYNALTDPVTNMPRAYMNSVWADVLTNQVGRSDPRVAVYDVAFVELGRNAVTGRLPEEVHGSNGIVFNLGPFANFAQVRNLGYNLGSRDPTICTKGAVAAYTGPVNLGQGSGYTLTMLTRKMDGCVARRGMSGGPWFIQDDVTPGGKGPTGLVFGVNGLGMTNAANYTNPLDMWSTRSEGYISEMYSPNIGDWTLGLYQAASRLVPEPWGWGMR